MLDSRPAASSQPAAGSLPVVGSRLVAGSQLVAHILVEVADSQVVVQSRPVVCSLAAVEDTCRSSYFT